MRLICIETVTRHYLYIGRSDKCLYQYYLMGTSLESPRALNFLKVHALQGKAGTWPRGRDHKPMSRWRPQGSDTAVFVKWGRDMVRDRLSVLNCFSDTAWQHAEPWKRGKLLPLCVVFI